MSTPTGIKLVIPSALAVGEEFCVKVRVLGPIRKVESKAQWRTPKPALGGPYNLNVNRQIQFLDNCLPDWQGCLRIKEAEGLEGPDEIRFDGEHQGAYPDDPKDKRAIRTVGGFKCTKPGFYFVQVVDADSGLEASSNPVYVTEEAPAQRIYWGDPHWQTFFTDGIRCPEELYAFARNEAFLDFGAISDHMEGLTPRQWDYFQAVTNDFNEPNRFVTLVGQEWTNHLEEGGAPGHRNIYVRGDKAPLLAATDPECNTLEKLWSKLEGLEAIAIPHHSANVVMGVKWEMGWNPEYEKAVEIHSVWGNSEKPADAGNPIPIENSKGEMKGRHVIDALRMGYRLGFVGGGDIHDGRPGAALHNESYPPKPTNSRDQGFTAALVPELTREDVYDAIKDRRTYATTASRIYLHTSTAGTATDLSIHLRTASEDGIREAAIVTNDGERIIPNKNDDSRIMEQTLDVGKVAPDQFCYVRITTDAGNMAWSSPVWGDEIE